MYRVMYGGELLHDPRSDNVRLDELKLEQNIDECGFCDFTIYPNHPMYGKLVELDTRNPIRVYSDDEIIFQGFVYELGKDFQTLGSVKCKGELAYLGDTVVRPYSTIEGVYKDKAPAEVDGYFTWLIEQHNKQVDSSKQFAIGINEANLLDKNNYIFRESKKLPSTLDELREKMLENDNLGGHIRVRYPEGVRTIDYLSEFYDVNAQIFDFGINLTDYTETDDSNDVYTAIIPTGKTRDAQEGEDSEHILPLGIDGLDDGVYAKDARYYKVGDMVYCSDTIRKYGLKCCTYSNEEITDPKHLLDAAVLELKSQISPIKTIEIKAVDLALVNDKFKPLKLGEYVRVRSKLHNFDSYMLCTSINPDLNNPENSLYTLGTTFDTLTGIQNKKIKELNATINSKYEKVEALSEEAKKAADAAVISTYDEYAVGDSSTTPPSTGWSKETPKWTEGKYIWRRVISKYGDGRIVTGKPALMTGNTGADGQDSIFLQILSSNGNLFKNSTVSTTLTVTIIVGDKTITSSREMHEVFGPNSSIEWEQKRFRETAFTKLDPNDPRLSDNGFILTLEPKDVYTQTVFNCILNY